MKWFGRKKMISAPAGITRHGRNRRPYTTERDTHLEPHLHGSARAIGAPRSHAAPDPASSPLVDWLCAFGHQRGRHAALPGGQARQHQPSPSYVPPFGERATRIVGEDTSALDAREVAAMLAAR